MAGADDKRRGPGRAGDEPQALEEMARALWWSGDPAGAVQAAEHAWESSRAADDSRGAARAALWLYHDCQEHRGDTEAARDWLERARRALQGGGPGPEQAWLALWDAHDAILVRAEVPAGRRLLGEARRLGRTLDLLDVEVMALGLEGTLLVLEGRVREGLRRLDQAANTALAGEMKDLDAIAQVCSYAMATGERLLDFSRASHWSQRARLRFVALQLRPGATLCRGVQAAALTHLGEWPEAEAELLALRSELPESALPLAAEAVSRLAELRRRQGRVAEASALFARVETHPRALLGQAALVLDEGDDPEVALAFVGRYLGTLAPEDILNRAPALALSVPALLRLEKDAAARAAATELFALAEAAKTDGLRAVASVAQGALAASAGDHAAARRCFEDAVERFEKTHAPFDAARARLDLSRALAGDDHPAEAKREASRALTVFDRLGALGESARARRLLED